MQELSENVKCQAVNATPLVRVLIIEDHDLSAHIARRFLEDLGCKVDCVSDGAAALKLFEDESFACDLVFMDVSLPGIDGYELATRLKKVLGSKVGAERDQVHIVALTARSSAENEQGCLSAGMSEVLVKPLLKTTARQVLRSYVPKWKIAYPNRHTEHLVTAASDIEGDAINFESALAIHNGDIEFIKGALQVVVDNLIAELDQLQSACLDRYWDKSGVIVHKLQGGTRYFGLERLDRVCETFSKVLQHDPESHWREVYNVLVSEVERVRNTYQLWLNKMGTA